MKLTVKLLIACIIFSWGLFAPMTVYSQSITLRDKVSFSAKKVTVAEALENLSRKVGLTFSYNPDQVLSKRIVNIDFKNRMLLEILDGILGPSQFRFQLTGKQVIIFKNKNSQPFNITAEDSDYKLNLHADTVFIPISSTVHDTLIVKDTIKKVDTIKVEIVKPQVNTSDLQDQSLLNDRILFNLGFSVSYMLPKAHYRSDEEFMTKLDEYKKHYSEMIPSRSYGIEVSATRNKMTLASGVSFTSFAIKLNYDYLISNGGYYRKDTLDPYYTITGTDTTWFYLVDSTYIPIDNIAYNYSVNNHVRHLEIPITLSYNMEYKGMSLFVKGGLIPGFYIGADGRVINIEEQGTIPARKIEHRRMVLSYILGAGIRFPLDNKLTLLTSMFYRSHINTIHSGFPINMRYSAFGINAILVYKIKQSEKY